MLSKARVLRPTLALLIAMPFAVGEARASGGPYIVDDAEIVDPGTCEVDLWHTRGRNSFRETVVAPACQLIPNVELSVTGTWLRQESTVFIGEAGAKTVLVAPEIGNLGIAIGGGIVHAFTDGSFEGAFVSLPATFWAAEPVRINVNVGWDWEHSSRRHHLTYGVGANLAVRERLILIGEVHGMTDGSHALQTGLRPILIEDGIHLDIVYGQSLNGRADPTFTIGLNFVF